MKTTVTKIANEVGISQGFLSNILACRRHPQWATALELGKVLGTDPRFWMKGESTTEERWLAFKNAPSTRTKPVLKKQNSNPVPQRKVLKKEGPLPCAQ